MGDPVKLGSIVPLTAQLDKTPNVTAFVRAFLEDDTCGSLGTKDLTACTGGRLFKDNTFAMPNNIFITATYRAFSDAAFTIPHPDFIDQEAVESFARLDVPTGAAMIVGRVGISVRPTIKVALSVGKTSPIRLSISAENIRLKVTAANVKLQVRPTKRIRTVLLDSSNIVLSIRNCT